MPSVSIVICSIEHSGREERLAHVINCLRQQSGIEQEIVLVWQGSEETAPTFPDVSVLVTDLCSSAESRNRGADVTRHPFVTFFDDDTLPVDHDHLERAVAYLESNQIDFLTCNIHSEGRVQSGALISSDVDLNRNTIISNMWEPGLMLRRQTFSSVRFDETLGIGCLHGSSEGFDLGVRLLNAGYRGRRVAAFLVDHPPLDMNVSAERYFFYSLGNGAALLQHRYFGKYVVQIGKALGRCLLGLLTGDLPTSRNACIRALSMLAGPLLPRRPARVLPRGHRKREPRFVRRHSAIDQ
jgi:hypothetical protein